MYWVSQNSKMPSFSYNPGNRVSGTAAAPASSSFFGVETGPAKSKPLRCVFESDDDEEDAKNSRKAHRAE